MGPSIDCRPPSTQSPSPIARAVAAAGPLSTGAWAQLVEPLAVSDTYSVRPLSIKIEIEEINYKSSQKEYAFKLAQPKKLR